MKRELTPTALRFIELEKKKADVKRYFDELKQVTEDLVSEYGVDTYFQDPSDGTVFKLVVPEGRFVQFDKYSYVRTRRQGEKRGDLSLKEAKDAGFEIGDE